ncbi:MULTISPECIES: ABC transporter permease subunit [Pseudomonas]|uniref:ABC transporter permease subunit n=1 Tax=Pseudomonas quercus TaxID=2722792 RepID=A0ABX0YC61_9PSED|nr:MULTISPECIES: ABC transporter permease subunit [Pseudomonas]MBF7142382.1 ABC transporter permease subunit [Pseudomonas sp. LY10J]NJP00920.1 ABC transporter permease subunit [Pseudomonas quercus]
MKDPASRKIASGMPLARIDFHTPAMQRHRRVRALVDRLTQGYVWVGGLAVLAAITLIFFYLAYVVAPLFQGASLTAKAPLSPPWLADAGQPVLLTLEEQNRLAMRVSAQGEVVFFSTRDGSVVSRVQLPIPAGVTVASVSQDPPGKGLVALGLGNGQVLIFRHQYQTLWPDNHKTIAPSVEYPYGRALFTLNEQGHPVQHVSLSATDDSVVLAGTDNATLQVLTLAPDATGTWVQHPVVLPQLTASVQALYIDPRQQWLYVINGRAYADVFDLPKRALNGRYKLLEGADARVTASAQLVGGVSLLVGSDTGTLGQWFMTRDPDGEPRLSHIRDFRLGTAPIARIRAEQRRKGFIALDESGRLGVFHSTAHRTLLAEPVIDSAGLLALSPRADRVMIETQGELHRFNVHNPHPEVSWSALWDKVWYEHYNAPEYLWQSTAANADFEPKLSLAPLAFGTLKAAFYAMLLAAPLAVAAAVYTAYFMAPGMRRKVKPVIELMEAMPTVILGLIAGLVLAPFVESHLPGLFSLLLVTPLGILLFGLLWSRMPLRLRLSVPEGWESALLIPVILVIGISSLTVSPWLEHLLFDGDMRHWLSNALGLAFDQRNALVVGFAMGFAVIPTIYSIAEDAVFSVPRSLTFGSLALGATPWQTLTRVVLLTASPGIFSALMIGMGRAVGETMIVLMATGNTPIMDLNLLEGMRTLAANVAIEMPESEVGSSHYRVLFLAALVLLLFTFVMNTVAELIRQRLRKQYSSL